MKNNLLRLPQGTESLYLEETYRHKKILRRMEDLTESWGYHPVQTPVFDYYDNYRSFMDHRLEEQTYKLIDREGELMMLRSDITLFLARQMGMVLSEEELPVRLYYADSILRHQDDEDMSSHESFQTGCELIGCSGKEGDLEIIFLLAEILRTFRLPLSRIHIGSSPIFQTIASPFSKEDSSKLHGTLHTRDKESLCRILQSVYGKEEAESLTDLLLFIGTGEQFSRKRPSWEPLLNGALIPALAYLHDIYQGWSALDAFDDMFRIDLSETGDQPYYSGVVFNAYTAGCGSALASGGRYDGMLDNFGYDGSAPASSVGFSLFLRKLEKLSGLDTGRMEPLHQEGQDRMTAAERLKGAAERRNHTQEKD